MKIFNGNVIDLSKLCLTFTVTEEPNSWIKDSDNTLFRIEGRTDLKEGIRSKQGLGYFRRIYVSSGGETIYTNDSGYLKEDRDEFGSLKESAIFVTPSKACLSLNTVGNYFDNSDYDITKNEVLGNIPIESCKEVFHTEQLKDLCKTDHGLFGVKDDVNAAQRSLSEEELEKLISFISKIANKHSVTHVQSKRKEFLDIVEGEIPIVVPELGTQGYYALPVRVMTGCEGKCRMCEFYGKRTIKIWDTVKVLDEIDALKRFMEEDYKDINRFFLSDGDALVLETPSLEKILTKINDAFNLDYEYNPANPSPGFAYAFAKPLTIVKKMPEDLVKLRRAGLGFVNMGMETGCQELLNMVKEDLALKDLKTAIQKLDDAGLQYSVNIIPELGGGNYKEKNFESMKAFFNSIRFDGSVFLAPLQRGEIYKRFLKKRNLKDNPKNLKFPANNPDWVELFLRYQKFFRDNGITAQEYRFISM